VTVLVSRHATPTPNTPAVADTGSAMELLEVELRRAQAIARAKDALPRSYRDNPGAVLLADQWARSRGIDTLTAIQSVSFVDGKPLVDATMQRALAERAGYEIRVVDLSDEAATVIVLRGGAELGRETFTMNDARRQGLAGKQNWQRTPRNMLVARATSNALRFYAPSVLLGLTLEDDIADPTEVLAPVTTIDGPGDGASPASADPRPAPTADVDTGEIIDAELVDEPEQAAMRDGTITVADLKAALKQAGVAHGDAIRWATEHTGEQVPNLTAIAARHDLAVALLDWLQASEALGHGCPMGGRP
jgi:hypothetical protein